MTFGEKLKQARTNAGMKQSELAALLGTTNTTISNWEKGVSKPDLDTLSYICGILKVRASFFLQPIVPDDGVTIPEFNMVKKYRELDEHGKDMVDTVLDKEYDRCKIDEGIHNIHPIQDRSYLTPEAAHERTDIEVTEEMIKHDDDIMDDDDFWK